jgi:4a-hydroxytetrahydrobiopterin dehydratase
MPALSPQDTEIRVRTLSGWQIESGELTKTFSFKDFLSAVDFVNQIAKIAEGAGHHPDIDIRYNRVRIALVTHDAGGLTEKDFELASGIEKLA